MTMNTNLLPSFSKRFRLDLRSDSPIYQQIVDQIKAQIVGGELEPGDQLPTVRALATDLRINFNTVARAYRILDEERIISTQQGRGTYITEQPPPRVTERMRRESLEALARRYVSESVRLGFADSDIRQMVNEQLKARKEESSKGD